MSEIATFACFRSPLGMPEVGRLLSAYVRGRILSAYVRGRILSAYVRGRLCRYQEVEKEMAHLEAAQAVNKSGQTLDLVCPIALCARYAMSGTDRSHADIGLRARYRMPGVDIASTAISLQFCYTTSEAGIVVAITRTCALALDMQRRVLT
eukprot:752308-Rhodomonas_salina.1